MRKFIRKILILCLSLNSLLFSAAADSFRVHKVIPVHFSEETQQSKITSGINDALFIMPEGDMTFISGIELTIKIPEEIATWRDSVAYSFYKTISPAPSEDNHDYSGEKHLLQTLPPKLSLTLIIPFQKETAQKQSPYAVVIPPLPEPQKGIFIRFQLVMKGVPDNLERSTIEITAKPVLKNQGMLCLKTTPESSNEKNYSVFIDDKPESNFGNLILQAGEHHLSIVSDSYRNEVRTFIIEQGKKTNLEVILRGSEPVFQISSPSTAIIYLDEKPLKNIKEAFTVSAGEHTVRFILGEYEVVKNITAITGKTYKISLDIDASILESE